MKYIAICHLKFGFNFFYYLKQKDLTKSNFTSVNEFYLTICLF